MHEGEIARWDGAIVVASLSLIRLTNSQWMETQPCLGGSELRLDNRQKGSGLRLQGVQGLDRGTGGQLSGQKPPPPQQQSQRSQSQRQKTPAQSQAPSPAQEEESYEVLLAALNGLIPKFASGASAKQFTQA